MKVAASVLSADFSRLGEEVNKVEAAGTDWLHLDVMDGHFVPNITFGAPIIAKLRPLSNLIFDVHLMIDQPEKLLQDFIHAGANYITVHQEATTKLDQIIETLRNHKIKIGLSIRPQTPIEVLFPYLEKIDMILLMSVEPGFGGQALIPEVLPKADRLRQLRDNNPSKYHYLIEMDGGINDKTIATVKANGVDVSVAGSFIFKAKDYKVPIEQLR